MNIRLKQDATAPAGKPIGFDNRYRLSDGTKVERRAPPAPAKVVIISAPSSKDDDRLLRTCLGCNARHPFNEDGTPVGGALPCGH